MDPGELCWGLTFILSVIADQEPVDINNNEGDEADNAQTSPPHDTSQWDQNSAEYP